MSEKKITKKVVLGELVKFFENNEIESSVISTQDVVDYATHEIELLERKASKSGTTKVQKENEILKNEIVVALQEIGRAVTISELVENTSNEKLHGLSNQKMSALLKQLYDNKVIYKAMIKKRAYFSATEIVVEEVGKGE